MRQVLSVVCLFIAGGFEALFQDPRGSAFFLLLVLTQNAWPGWQGLLAFCFCTYIPLLGTPLAGPVLAVILLLLASPSSDKEGNPFKGTESGSKYGHEGSKKKKDVTNVEPHTKEEKQRYGYQAAKDRKPWTRLTN